MPYEHTIIGLPVCVVTTPCGTLKKKEKRKRDLKVWYIALTHTQAWRFADCLREREREREREI